MQSLVEGSGGLKAQRLIPQMNTTVGTGSHAQAHVCIDKYFPGKPKIVWCARTVQYNIGSHKILTSV